MYLVTNEAGEKQYLCNRCWLTCMKNKGNKPINKTDIDITKKID